MVTEEKRDNARVDAVSPVDRSTAVVRIPSLGKLYVDEEMRHGKVEVAAMRFADEAIFRNLSAQGQHNEALGVLLNRCVTAPRTLMRDILLPIDEFYILLAIRAVSYGPEYSFTWTCPSCGAHNEDTVNIMEELKVKHLDPSIEGEPLSYTFESSGIPVKIKAPRILDRRRVEEYTNKLSKNDRYKAELYGYAIQTVEFNGRKGVPVEELMELWGNLPSSDVKKFDNWLVEILPDVDTTISKKCSTCDFIFEGDMPLTAEFFQPSDSGRGLPSNSVL